MPEKANKRAAWLMKCTDLYAGDPVCVLQINRRGVLGHLHLVRSKATSEQTNQALISVVITSIKSCELLFYPHSSDISLKVGRWCNHCQKELIFLSTLIRYFSESWSLETPLSKGTSFL